MLYFLPSAPNKFSILNDPALDMDFKSNKICFELVDLDINVLRSLEFSTSTTCGCRLFARNFCQSSKIESFKSSLIMLLIRFSKM